MADEIGKYLPQGIGVGFEAEVPDLKKDIEKQLDGISDIDLRNTVASMTSAVVGDYNVAGLHKVNTVNESNISLNNSINSNVAVELTCDGRVLARTVAPYQDEFTDYYRGR